MRLPARLALVFVVTSAAVTGVLSPVTAQAQLAENQRAVLAFDVYIDRLRSSDLAQETGMDDPAGALMPPGGEVGVSDSIDIKELRRVFGAFSAPPDLASVNAAFEGEVEELPMNFFVRVQFKSPDFASESFKEMMKTSQEVTVAGKQYYRPPADDTNAPKNMLAHMSAPDTIEIGTDGYITQPDRNVFSANLMKAWPKMPIAGIRVAFDLDGSRALINEAMAMAGEIPMMAQPAVSIVENMSVLRLGIDFTGENMLWLTAMGRDAEGTTQINNALSGLLAMAKPMGEQTLAMAPPEAAGPAKVILDALVTKVDENDVNIVIPKPDGLEKAMGSLFGQMVMGGMGPGGGDFGPGGADFGAGDDFGAGGDDPFGGLEVEMDEAPKSAAEAAAEAADPFGGAPGDDDPFGN